MGAKQSKPLANVYIFNKIKNNSADIELLRTTFEALMCVVEVIEVQNKTYSKLKKIVKTIVEGNFIEFKYFVTIILDNDNEDEHIWVTKFGKNFHFHGDLITAICANKTLEGKFRFSILQTNRVPSEKIKRRKQPLCKPKIYSGIDLRYYATSTGCVINHEWKEGETSHFIRILCDEINQNVRLPIADQLTIDKLLDYKVSAQLAKYMDTPARSSISKPFILGNAK